MFIFTEGWKGFLFLIFLGILALVVFQTLGLLPETTLAEPVVGEVVNQNVTVLESDPSFCTAVANVLVNAGLPETGGNIRLTWDAAEHCQVGGARVAFSGMGGNHLVGLLTNMEVPLEYDPNYIVTSFEVDGYICTRRGAENVWDCKGE